MKRDFVGLIKKIGRFFFKFVMKNYKMMKPLLQWVDPKARSHFKAIVLRPIFKTLYSADSNAKIDTSLNQGVTLVGYPHADIGDGEFLRQTAKALLKVDADFGIYNYNSGIRSSQNDQRLAPFIRRDNPYRANIFFLKPDQIEASVVSLGNSFVNGRYNIGYWVWELSGFPKAWVGPLKYFNEIWCPSRFIQSTVSKYSTGFVVYMPPAFEIENSKEFDRAYFSLPKERFLFLFVFDFKSYISRKNPLGCIQAFQKAFPKSNKNVGLILKSMDGNQYPDEFMSLNKAVQGDSRINLIDATFSSEEIIGLMSVCDSFVSLHRSEGTGLSIAQSMLLGKPVIATNYSGNTDFTRPDNSCLVDCKLIEVNEGEYPFYQGQVWADPNIDQAANYMQKLVEDDVYRCAIAKAGCSYIKTYHNSETIGGNYRSRLIELELLGESSL